MTDDAQEKPVGAIAKVGTSRWFFVYWPTYKAQYDASNDWVDPHSHGFVDSMAKAVEKCGGIETFTYRLDRTRVRGIGRIVERIRWNAQHALEWRSIFAARRRKPNVKASPNVKLIEHIYHNHYSDYRKPGSHPHRILKKTAKYIFIERSCYSHVETCGGVSRVPSRALDRARLESGETLYANSWANSNAYHLGADKQHEEDIPECFASLGVKPPFTRGRVKSAFRLLSRSHHPDVGGDPERFRNLREQYEAALAQLGAE